MKLFCKCEEKKTIGIDDVIKHLKQYDDEALKNVVEAVKLSRKADEERDKALEILAENWYQRALAEQEGK